MLASSPSIDPATMLCPQGKIGGIREGGCDNPTRDNSVLSPKPLHLVIKR
jgi:hypothetical protein